MPCVLTAASLAPRGSAAATPTYYDDQVEFKAALDGTLTDDYSNPGYSENVMSNAVMSAVLGETEYFTTGFGDNNRVILGAYCGGCNGSFQLSFTATSVGTNDGVHGVGLNVIVDDPVMPYTAFLTFADGTTENVLMPAAGEFWGVIAPERVTQIHFGLPGGGIAQTGDFRIDDLTIGNQVLAYESCDGEVLDLSSLTPGSGATVTQEGSTASAGDDLAETDEVACWVGDDAPEHVYQFAVGRPSLLQIDLEGSSYDTKLAVVSGCPAGDVSCQFNDDGTGLASALDCTQYEAGAYSIIVSGAGSVGDYQLNVRDCGAPCGDGVVGGAEDCDDGGESATCDEDCSDAVCGDGTTNATAGEDCDDGNTADGDGCSATCTMEAADSSGGSGDGGDSNGSTSAGGSASAASTEGADSGSASDGVDSSSSGGEPLAGRSGCGCSAGAEERRDAAFSAMFLLALATCRRSRRPR